MNREPLPDDSSGGSRRTGSVRVAYVVYSFQAGGVERCVAHLCNRLDRSRFQPIVVCLSRTGNAAEWLARDDIPVIELHKKEGNDVRTVLRLARLLRRHDVSLVHSHNWGTLLETVLARRMAGTPVHVHAERGMELEALSAGAVRRRLRQRVSGWAFRRTNCLLTNCQAIRRRLVDECRRLESLTRVIPNGVAPFPAGAAGQASASVLRGRHGIPRTATVVGTVGRLAAVKDFPNLVRAVALLKETQPDVHLVIVGEGPQHPALAALANSLELEERLHLVGWCPDAAGWLCAMDVYVNTSLNEGMSQSILEAMAAGLPTVVSDVGDSAALVGGDHPCGLVVPAADPQRTAGAIRTLVSDAGLAGRFRENARRRHESLYSLEAMIQSYEMLYDELLALKTGGPTEPKSQSRPVRTAAPASPPRDDAAAVEELARQ